MIKPTRTYLKGRRNIDPNSYFYNLIALQSLTRFLLDVPAIDEYSNFSSPHVWCRVALA